MPAPVVTLVDAATVLVNASLGNDFRLTLGGYRTIANPTSPTDGQDVKFILSQPASGGPYTVVWGNAYSFGAAGPPNLTSYALAADLIEFTYHAALGKWLYTGSILGFR